MTLREPIIDPRPEGAPDLVALRARIRNHVRAPEDALVRALIAEADLSGGGAPAHRGRGGRPRREAARGQRRRTDGGLPRRVRALDGGGPGR